MRLGVCLFAGRMSVCMSEYVDVQVSISVCACIYVCVCVCVCLRVCVRPCILYSAFLAEEWHQCFWRLISVFGWITSDLLYSTDPNFQWLIQKIWTFNGRWRMGV